MLIHMRIGIIGCGHMGSAIAKALLTKKNGVYASNPEKPHLIKTLSKNEAKKFHWVIDNVTVVKKTAVIFVAVKPEVVQQVLNALRPFLRKNHIVISIAAGIPLKKLYMWSGHHQKIVRVMPNLPAQVFEGVSVWKAQGLQRKEKKLIQHFLNSFGVSIEVQKENLIDVATALSGGAPAYVAAFLESMAKTAQQKGFSKESARTLAFQGLYGSAIYIKKAGIDFSDLKKAVQTKGGTTEAAFKMLTKKKWQGILESALIAGYKKTCELSSVP